MRKLLERVLTLLLLLLVMGVFSNLYFGSDLREDSGSAGASHVGLSVLELAIFLGCAAFALIHYKQFFRSLKAGWPFLAVSFYAVASTAWSVDPGTTLRRGGVLLGTTMFGIYLGGRYSVGAFQKTLLQSFLILLGASFLMLLVLPSSVLDQYHTGAFRGLTEHKNIFGEYMAILLLLTITSQLNRRWRRARPLLVLFAFGMELWAHSGTSLLAIVVTLVLLPVLYLLRFRKDQMAPLLAFALGFLIYGATLISKFGDSILDLMGKDRTLTGRAEVWALVELAILRRPLLGYGYDAFWAGLKGESSRVISVVGWQVAHSHNGYLEALLGFGAVGGCIIVLALLKTAKDALVYARRERSAAGWWPFGFLLFYLIHSTAEAGLIKRDGLSYLLIVVVSTSLALRQKQEHALTASNMKRHSNTSAEGTPAWISTRV